MQTCRGGQQGNPAVGNTRHPLDAPRHAGTHARGAATSCAQACRMPHRVLSNSVKPRLRPTSATDACSACFSLCTTGGGPGGGAGGPDIRYMPLAGPLGRVAFPSVGVCPIGRSEPIQIRDGALAALRTCVRARGVGSPRSLAPGGKIYARNADYSSRRRAPASRFGGRAPRRPGPGFRGTRPTMEAAGSAKPAKAQQTFWQRLANPENWIPHFPKLFTLARWCLLIL